jgi:hypothetical protein
MFSNGNSFNGSSAYGGGGGGGARGNPAREPFWWRFLSTDQDRGDI